MQESTRESHFYLLYGRDPRLPTTPNRELVDLDDYKCQVATGLPEAWALARKNVEKAQQRQKIQHNRRAKDPRFQVDDRVFVYMPGEKLGKVHKLARPFREPYSIVTVYDNGAEVRLIDKPHSPTIRVALNRVRRCPSEIPDTEAPIVTGPSVESTLPAKTNHSPDLVKSSPASEGPWKHRLRSRK